MSDPLLAPEPRRFAAGLSTRPDWRGAVEEVLEAIGRVDGASVGLVYATDAFEDDLEEIVLRLSGATGIGCWIGTLGLGVLGPAADAPGIGPRHVEVFDRPALSVLVAALPPDSHHPIPPIGATAANDTRTRRVEAWLQRKTPGLALVHGDPRNPQTPAILSSLAEETGSFLIGGLTSSQSNFHQVCIDDDTAAAMLSEGGVSGLLIDAGVPVITGLSQGCSPIGREHEITRCDENVLIELDGRPALEVFKEDIGDLLARDLRRTAGYIFAGLPIVGSDTGDYVVRNIIGYDTGRDWIGIAELVSPGQRIVFTRRDHGAAVEDLDRMVDRLTRRLNGRRPQAGIYISCLARGPNLFGPDSAEIRQIEARFPDVPIVGFFANGEISRDQLYGYTGVLTLFL